MENEFSYFVILSGTFDLFVLVYMVTINETCRTEKNTKTQKKKSHRKTDTYSSLRPRSIIRTPAVLRVQKQ